MLPILKDPEVTKFLLEYINETPGGRRSVSRISRTCKALSEPALNVLWKELDSLIPLLSLMPNHLFKRPRRPGMGFAKNPSPEDWKRLIAHGERVKKITYNEGVGNVHPDVFAIVEDGKPQDYILPNLKGLVWKVETAEGLERSLLFLSSQLRCLTVEVGSGIPQDELVEFLTEVSSSTRLTTLSITSPNRIPHYLPRLLQQQTTLEKVAFMAPGSLSPSIGRWLSSMSSLKSLQIDVGDRSDGVIASFFTGVPTSGVSSPSVMSPGMMSPRISSPDIGMTPLPGMESGILVDFSKESGFKQLRHLSLTGEVSSVSNFLGRVLSPLQSIELALDEPDEAKDWRSLWSTISRQFKNSLRSIVITASGNSRFTDLIRSTARGENAARRLRLDGLEQFPWLSRFELDLPESRVFLDEDLQHLAMSCPNLEVVKLCPLSRWPIPYGPPKATLAGIAPLTAQCKRLHTLHIPIHAKGTDDFSLFDIEYSSRALERLHVGHSWVEDTLGASILLSHLAPYLDSLKWFHEKNRPGYVEAHNVGWTRVSEILPQLQRLRLHERDQAQAHYTSTYQPKAELVVAPLQVPIAQPPAPPPAREMVSRAVQARSPMADFGSQTKTTVRHKGISTKPFQRDEIVDATPFVLDRGVEAVPPIQEEAVEAQPVTVDQSIGTDASTSTDLAVHSNAAREEFNEKEDFSESGPNDAAAGYVGQSAGYISQVLHAVTPPILFKLFTFFSMFSIHSEIAHHDSDPVFASVPSPLTFTPKITPS